MVAEYIDREALIAEFDRLGLGEHSLVERVFSDRVRTIIAGIPATDVAPVVHGRWINAPLCGNAICRCSVCGYMVNVHANLSGRIMQKFCTSCGAKMDGGGNDGNV